METVYGKIRKIFKTALVASLLLLLVLSQQACGNKKYFSQKLDQGSADTGPFDPPVNEQEKSCYSLTENQPDETEVKKVDILIVTDTSGSLNDERQRVADGIDNFIAALGNDVDFQIGVMLAHGDQSQYSGALYQADNEDVVLSSSKLSRSEIRNMLEDKLTDVEDDNATDGGEAGLYSLNRSLSGTALSQIQAQGFYRKDAGLAVVFVSDENDICGEIPNGVTPVRDPSGQEEEAQERLCGNITETIVYQNIRALKGLESVILSSIIYTDTNQVPSRGENEVGYGYKQITELNKGLQVDILRDNIAMGLGKIGELTSKRLELKTRFAIEDTSTVDPQSIRVYVDANPVSFEYFALSGTIEIPEELAGGSGSNVQIEYCTAE